MADAIISYGYKFKTIERDFFIYYNCEPHIGLIYLTCTCERDMNLQWRCECDINIHKGHQPII